MPATYAPSGWTVDAFLCDSAVAVEGKVYIQGGGWNLLHSPVFPFAQDRIGVAAIVSVPYTETNKNHVFELRLEDQDGALKPLGHLPGPDGQPQVQMKIMGNFMLGRPPILQAGDAQNVPIALNLDNLMFEAPGSYSFVLSIDEKEIERLTFRVVNPLGFMVAGA